MARIVAADPGSRTEPDLRYRHPVERSDRLSRSRLFLGPWPFVPLVLFLLGSLAYFNRSVIVAGVSAEGQGEYTRILAVLTLQGIVLTAVAVTPMVVLGGWRDSLSLRYRADRVPTRARYLTGVVLAGLIGGLIQFLYRYVAIDDVTGQGVFASVPLSLATNVVLTTTFSLVISNVAGYAAYRIGLQTRALEAQVRQLEEQRRQIVEADQRARTEVAQALHDDVQGALLRAVLRLNRLADGAAGAEAEGLRAVIADLEALRGDGVRAISRRLAPPIESVGIGSALEDLAETYRGSLAAVVTIEDDALAALGGWPDGELAVYRIAEQGLLNAAGHGQATRAEVTVEAVDGAVRLAVRDDGAGLAQAITPGMGLAVVDAWVGVVGGTWRLEPRPDGGAELAATLPVAAAGRAPTA